MRFMIHEADEDLEPSIGDTTMAVCSMHGVPLTLGHSEHGQAAYVCLICQEMGVDGGVTYAPVPIFDPEQMRELGGDI
jgi:hypothetical protein